jgi:hypothetical protein
MEKRLTRMDSTAVSSRILNSRLLVLLLAQEMALR